MSNPLKEISLNGLWKNNPALVQLLGLCPLLAVTSTLINGLALGLATTLVLVGSNATVSTVRHWVPGDIRLPVFVIIIAAYVTVIELLMQAFVYELFLTLGIFINLIVTNCAILGRADAFACKNPVLPASMDGLMQGLGFTAVLVVLGAIREILGQGTLFSQANLLFGDWAQSLTIDLFHLDSQFLVMVLPPGAFIGMGFLIALKNIIDKRIENKRKATEPKRVIERARVAEA
jgi:electron transport complex protein RnfE